MVCYVLSAVQLRQARRKGGCLLGERCQQCHACSVQRTPEGSSAADVAFLGIVAQHKAFDVTNLFCLLLSSLISSGLVKHLFSCNCSSSYDAMLCVTATGIPQACDTGILGVCFGTSSALASALHQPYPMMVRVRILRGLRRTCATLCNVLGDSVSFPFPAGT